jgi:hypothetical protein
MIDVNKKTGDHKLVWMVSNSRVLCLYKSQSYLTIVKLFRNSEIILKNIPTTPCFFIIKKNKNYNNNNDSLENDKVMLCGNSVQEKESWILNINNNIAVIN